MPLLAADRSLFHRWPPMKHHPVDGSSPGGVCHAMSQSKNFAPAAKAPRPPIVRDAAALVIDGLSFADAGAALGTTDRGIEGRLYRYRKGKTA
jgi:hypothetical protein